MWIVVCRKQKAEEKAALCIRMRGQLTVYKPSDISLYSEKGDKNTKSNALQWTYHTGNLVSDETVSPDEMWFRL